MAREKGKGRPEGSRGPLFIMNRWVLLGAALVLIGFTTLAVSDYAFASLIVEDPPAEIANPRYLGIAAAYSAGEALIGVGFFLALFGFARQIGAQA